MFLVVTSQIPLYVSAVKSGKTQPKGHCLKSGSFVAGDDQSSAFVDKKIFSNPFSYRVFVKTTTLQTVHKLERNDQRIGKKVADQLRSGKVFEKEVLGVTLNGSFDPSLLSLIARSWVCCYSTIASIFLEKKLPTNNMSLMEKARLLRRRGLTAPKNGSNGSKLLLLSGSNSDLSHAEDESHLLNVNSLPRSSSMRERSCGTFNAKSDENSNCTVSSLDRCNYSRIISEVSEGVRPCLPSPTLMRRRNAICDELEKAMISLPGRTLKQRRADMLRGIALSQFCLL